MNTIQINKEVWACRSHGLINRVRRGTPGTVVGHHHNGRIAVEWADGTITTVSPRHLGTRPEVDPHFAALIQRALDDAHRAAAPTLGSPEWNRGWCAARTALRSELIAHGLLDEDQPHEYGG